MIQPTHLDSRTLGEDRGTGAGGVPHWRSRAEDMRRVLDQLDEVEEAVPGLAAAWTGARWRWPGTRWAGTPRACCSAPGSPIRTTGPR
ncbi:hypothetical protein ACFQVA_11335 [Actinomadura keratinilytica]